MPWPDNSINTIIATKNNIFLFISIIKLVSIKTKKKHNNNKYIF